MFADSCFNLSVRDFPPAINRICQSRSRSAERLRLARCRHPQPRRRCLPSPRNRRNKLRTQELRLLKLVSRASPSPYAVKVPIVWWRACMATNPTAFSRHWIQPAGSSARRSLFPSTRSRFIHRQSHRLRTDDARERREKDSQPRVLPRQKEVVLVEPNCARTSWGHQQPRDYESFGLYAYATGAVLKSASLHTLEGQWRRPDQHRRPCRGHPAQNGIIDQKFPRALGSAHERRRRSVRHHHRNPEPLRPWKRVEAFSGHRFRNHPARIPRVASEAMCL